MDIAKRLKAKSILIWGATSIVFIIIILFMIISDKDHASLENKENKITKVTKIDIGDASIDADRLWRNQLEESLESKEQKLLKNLELAKEEMKKLTGEQELKNLGELEALKEQVRFLTEELARNNEREDNKKAIGISIKGFFSALIYLESSTCLEAHCVGLCSREI
jgi:hypothetical protein